MASAGEVVVLMVPSDYEMDESSERALAALVRVIFAHGDERTKARAMLCHIYHRCVRGGGGVYCPVLGGEGAGVKVGRMRDCGDRGLTRLRVQQ